MLPYEEEAKIEIAGRFQGEFSIAIDAFRLGLDVLGWGRGEDGSGLITVGPARGLTDTTIGLSLGLFTKCLRQLRSIILLCGTGLVSDTDTLSRCLFESVLALHFLLRPRLTLRENGRVVTADPKRRLTTLFRSWLYLAHVAFKYERMNSSFRNTGRLKRLAKHLGDHAAAQMDAQEAESRIGSLWAERLRKRGNYAGVSIRDLADSLRVLHWYNAVYAFQSSVAHAGDALSFVDPPGADQRDLLLGLSPDVEHVGQVLQVAVVLFLGALSIVNSRLKLGFDERVDAMIQSMKECSRQEPNAG
jgi:hypothetical protein